MSQPDEEYISFDDESHINTIHFTRNTEGLDIMNIFNHAITNINAEGIDKIKPLLEKSAFKPYRYLFRDLGIGLVDFWVLTIKELMRSSTLQGFLASQNGIPIGLLIISENPWESDLLGEKAAVINALIIDAAFEEKLQVALSLLEHAIQQATADGVKFLLSKTYTDDITSIHALELHGFLLMDTIVDSIFDYRRVSLEKIVPPTIAEDVILRLATPADRDQLVDVARQSFGAHFGRFHADERIGIELATQFYEQWMHSSIDGYADWIHLAEINKHIVGFSIWKKPSPLESMLKVRVGHYSIAGIHPDYHGRGLFTALTYAGMKSLNGIADIIEGPTHVNNYGVQKGYSKMGWRVVSDARHAFHKWL